MRTRIEIELEKTEQTDRLAPDGSEERMLFALLIEVALDCRDLLSTGGTKPPSPQGFGLGNVGAGRTPFEQE